MNPDQLLAKANTLGQEASKQTGVAFTPLKPAVQSGQPIDASLLGDAKPLVVPPPSVASTVSSGLGGTADAMAKSTDSSITQSLKAEADARKQEVEQSKGLFQNLQDKYNAVVGSRQSEEEKAGLAEKATAVAKARAEARTASDNIIASRQAQQNELNALEGQGLGEVQLAQKQSEINRRYGKDQANLSLEALKTSSILNNVDFDYQTASSIVDRKIQNELEPLKILMEQAQTFYQDNEKSFSKAEDRAFSQLVSEAKQKHDDEQSKLEKIGQIQLEAAKNGAPSSVIRAIGNAGSVEEAITSLGGYGSAQKVNNRQTQVIDVNGKKVLIDTQTGATIATITGDGSATDSLANAVAGNNIDNINNVINSKGLKSVVGPNGLSQTSPGLWGATKRFFAGALAGGTAGALAGSVLGPIGTIPGALVGALTAGVVNSLNGTKAELTGDRQAFIGSVEQLRGQLTLDSLVNAKKNGATFGALSDSELKLLANAGSKLSTWAETDNGKPDGKIIGYNVSEKDFKAEMDKINYFAKLDYIRKGGSPADIGAITQGDGTVWIQNSDGTLSQIK